MGKFKIGDKVRCVENGAAIKPHALGYKPGKEFVVDFINETIEGDIYFAKHDNGVFECDLILVKTLPKSFACTNTNQELWDKYISWLNKEHNGGFNGSQFNYYGINKDEYKDCCDRKDRYGTILSLEKWDEIVNGVQIKEIEKVMKKTITKDQLKQIHDVACSGWKVKILEFAARNPFGNTVEFTSVEIDEMFKASDAKQTKVLESIFGSQQQELDFRSNDINFKQDGIKVFGNSDDDIKDAFIGLPIMSTSMSKHKFFLNPDYVWKLDGGIMLICTRK